MKGLSILFISFHNFAHWIPGIPQENEFNFTSSNLSEFLDARFFEFPIDYFFSFFGHYGVQLFIFFSAYSYFKKREEILHGNHLIFLRNRFIKIGIPFLMIAVLTGVIRVLLDLWDEPDTSFAEHCSTLFAPLLWGVAKIFCLTPFMDGREYAGQGPWWFISMIMMFYLILPLLLRIKPSVKNLLIVNLVSFAMLYLSDTYLGWFNIRFTVMGHLPEIFFGFFIANLGLKQSKRFDNAKYAYLSIIPLFALLTFLNSSLLLWYLTAIPATIAFYYLFKLILKISGKRISNIFYLLGSLSLYIFLINGLIREVFIRFTPRGPGQLWHLVLLIASFTVTVFISALCFRVDKPIQARLKTILTPAAPATPARRL
ncbi:MAG TPA: acyltransferase [Phycisphaerae bacterium]|nr:acyltransferase [Phycisphaerae bacterium]